MKKKFVLIILIILILLFLLIITIYKFNISTPNYLTFDIEKINRNIKAIDLSMYSNDIITKNSWSNEYEFDLNSESGWKFSGKLYSENDALYLSDTTNNVTQEVLNEEIIQLVRLIDDENPNTFICYALTKSNDLYYMELRGHDINSFIVNKVNNDIKVKNLTLINYKYYDVDAFSIMIVLSTDDKLYYMPNNALYEPNSTIVGDSYILYSDMSISTNDGLMLKDESKNNYIAKCIFLLSNENPFEGNPQYIIYTIDNRIIYVVDNKLYLYNKKVKSVSSNDDSNNVIFKFDDNTEIKLDAYYNKDYFKL